MDWSKVRKILIYMFILLNAVLFINIMIIHNADNISVGIINDTTRILEGRGTKIICRIPRQAGEAGVPGYREKAYDRAAVAKVFLTGISGIADSDIVNGKEIKSGDGSGVIVFMDSLEFVYEKDRTANASDVLVTPGDLPSADNIGKEVIKLFKRAGLPVSGFITDSATAGESGQNGQGGQGGQSITVTMLSTYKSSVFFDIYIIAEADVTGIRKVECSIREIEGFSEPKQIIPAYQILLKYYGREGETITDIDFGYKLHKIEPGAQGYDIPVWRIRTGDGSVRFFKAYSGEEVL